MHTRPVWVEISRSKLIANYLELRRIAGNWPSPRESVEVMAVVKGDAYGHGMSECARLLAGAGANWIGVSSVEEGVRARMAVPEASILVMTGLWRGEAEAAIEHRLTPIVWEDFHLDLLEAAARRLALPPLSLPVHLEVDTGMSRQGVAAAGAYLPEILRRFHAESPLRLEGLATHFSAAEVLDAEETSEQSLRFVAALRRVESVGLAPAWIHAGNSANLLRGDPLPRSIQQAASRLGARLMLRPGLALYGYAPRFIDAGGEISPARLPAADLSPVLTWKARVVSLRHIEAGEAAGYNSTFRAVRPTTLALLPMGYADGLSRLLSNRGAVLLHGRRAPMVGRISMDHTILDVTGIPGVAIADEAVVIGEQGGESITGYEHADLAGTIPYEILCDIAARVPRVMVE
jgi:alanine racemase